MAQRVVTFGEIMLRLSTPGHQRFAQAASFEATFGGGEANVAAGLAQLGVDSAFVSKVPGHEIGQAAVNHLRRFGVDVAPILRGGNRLGIYFLETGASQRPSKVIYDREGSAIAGLTPEELDPARVLDGAAWLHWTGITPALGEGPAACVAELCRAARQRDVRVSCDLNFRAKLWTSERARSVMRPLMEDGDIWIGNEAAADKSLGLRADDSDVERGRLDPDAYARLGLRLREEFGFDTVAITMRESVSATRNFWSAIITDRESGSGPHVSARHDIHIVDRVGAGDAFASGLIAALLEGRAADSALEFAVAASCLKQTIPGDFNHVSRAEVERLLQTGGSGRVER